MDEWGVQHQHHQQQQQQQQRMTMSGIGPVHSYHSIRSRPSPYQYHQSVKTDSNPNVYTPVTYTPTHMEQTHQQRIITAKSTPGPIMNYHPGHHQMLSTRSRPMPYPSPSMYTHSSGPVCQCTQHMHYPSQHQMYYQNYYPYQSIPYQQNSTLSDTKSSIQKKNSDESLNSSTSYYPSSCSTNSYIPAQQLPPQSLSISQDYQTFSQLFPSPSSNPSTPYQGEFNGNTEVGVPYHHGQPSSVNSLTDALCPNGEPTDGQMTPGPLSVGTPRVTQHQNSFPHTPLTPMTPLTRSRLSNEQNIDELTAFLQDPINIYLSDDLTSTLYDDIEALADTYLGGGRNELQSNVDNNLDYDIILNYLCSDDLIRTN